MMKWRSLEESAAGNETRSLRDIYAERKELIAKYVPGETQDVHDRAVAELRESGIAERALQPHSAAPDFELQDQNGQPVCSANLLNSGPLVICFIRGRWCPFCVGQMEAMNAIVSELESLGAKFVAISPQTVHHNYLMSDQHKFKFPLLSDSGNNVARQCGIVYRVPDYQQDVYRRAFVNLPFLNGDASLELPIPATFVVGETEQNVKHQAHPSTSLRAGYDKPRTPGTVLYLSADPDYTNRPEPAALLRFLAQLSS